MSRTHGTRSCYVGGCRCEPCMVAQREYGRHYYQAYRKATEGVPHVPAARALAHVKRLRAAGMGKQLIADAAGLRPGAIDHLYRTSRGIRPKTERAILSVRFTTFLVDATPSRRRVQALARIGWTGQHIADASGVGPKVIAEMSAGRRPTVTRANAEAVARAFEALSMRLGPSEKARQRAEFKGWPPPLAWDDIDTDAEPAAGAMRDVGKRSQDDIDETAVARAIEHGGVTLTRAERVEVVRALASTGHSDPQIADRVGVTARTVERDRREHGIASRVGRAAA